MASTSTQSDTDTVERRGQPGESVGQIPTGRPWWGYVEEAAAGALLFAVAVVTTLGVAGRFTAVNPYTWTEPAARYLLIWLTAVGSVVLFKNRSHIEVDFLYLMMPRAARLVMDGFVIALQGAVGLYLLVYGWNLTTNTTAGTSVPGVSLSLVYAIVPISALLIIAYGIRDAVMLAVRARKDVPA